MINVKKKAVDKALQIGVIDRLNTLLSGAYLLNSVASVLIGKSEVLLEGHGLMMGELKFLHNNVNRAMDKYTRDFASLSKKEKQRDWMRDVDALYDLFMRWQNIPMQWEPGEPYFTENPQPILIFPEPGEGGTIWREGINNDEEEQMRKALVKRWRMADTDANWYMLFRARCLEIHIDGISSLITVQDLKTILDNKVKKSDVMRAMRKSKGDFGAVIRYLTQKNYEQR